MSDLNVTTIMGRLTRDPIFRNGRAKVAFFTVASNQCHRDDAGVLQEETAFVSCKVFGAWSEALADRHQGDMVIVSGRLRTESWEKDGARRSQLILIGNAVYAAGSPKGSGGNDRQTAVALGANAGENTPADQERPPF